ncbi:MAG: HNH endonuclease [Alphaproteobacteria bacterium]|nr:HNH endonuclease [Alphaproteobacteria bacterium]
MLERDHNACQFCGHVARKYMNVHHLNESGENNPDNLITCCVACHAVLHVGRNLTLGVVEVWESKLSQVEIVRATREGVKSGKTLQAIKKTLKLKKGLYPPGSIEYANTIVASMGKSPRASLEEPLSAVFINLKRWQIEQAT